MGPGLSIVIKDLNKFSIGDVSLQPSCYHLGLGEISKVGMVWEDDLFVDRILFDIDVVLDVAESDLNETIIVGQSGLWNIATNLAHHFLGLSSVVLLKLVYPLSKRTVRPHHREEYIELTIV